MSEPTPPDGDDVQVAFDVGALPGGPKGAIEAILMVVEEPVSDAALAAVLELPVEGVRELLEDLQSEHTDGRRGFTVRNVGGGWRFYSHAAYAPVVERFIIDGQQSKLTTASLETLAVIAYRQPISRARVGAVRGVNVDGVMRTLLNRGLVEEAGNDEATGAHLYRTSSYFLERIGVSSIDELPELAPLLPGMDDLEDEQEVAAADLVTAPATTHEASSAGDAAPSSSAEDR